MMAGEAKVRDEVAIGRLNTSPKTLEEVANLVNTCYRSKRNWTNESMLVSGGSRTTPPRLLRDAQCHEIYVARKGNEIVGCVKTGKVESTVVAKLPYPAGYVGLLAVDAEHQSKGIGTTLVRFAEKRCSDLGLDVIVMDVLSSRVDLIEWYMRLGYKPTGQSADARDVIEQCGEKLLTPASFMVLEKRLR